ncbi:unnamed protein product [Oppiella nova]|uniref:Uncharacterized protein n=1 Tax=Oppiella nova TaxID=334625 RepID=A0A7R9M292_9ACAR|nr:unnamed protein product [Oppiella nova]CAG2169384.1 unnamed protein product [Oppiella nova]
MLDIAIDFQIGVIGQKDEFKYGDTLDVYLHYGLPYDSVFTKVEFLKDDRIYFIYFRYDYVQLLDDAKDKGVTKDQVSYINHNKQAQLITLSIKRAVMETAGKFTRMDDI